MDLTAVYTQVPEGFIAFVEELLPRRRLDPLKGMELGVVHDFEVQEKKRT